MPLRAAPAAATRRGGFRSTATSRACRMASGGGGQPGTTTSTGIISATPPDAAKLGPKTPPEIAQTPIATTRFGVGIASQVLRKSGIRIASETGPADQEDIGVARRRRDEEAEAMHVVIGVVELAGLAHAGAAGAGIDKTDVQRAAESRVEPGPGAASSSEIRGPLIAGFPGDAGSRRRGMAAEAMNAAPLRDRDPAVVPRDRAGRAALDQARSASSAGSSEAPCGRPGETPGRRSGRAG